MSVPQSKADLLFSSVMKPIPMFTSVLMHDVDLFRDSGIRNYLAALAVPTEKRSKRNTIYDINDVLLRKLKSLVEKGIKKSARKDAMSILTNINVSPKTVMEFLFFAESDNWNIACASLDCAVDKKGKPIKTKSFKRYTK